MNLSSGTAPASTSGFISEPPLSPGPAPQNLEPAMPTLRTVETAPSAPAPAPTVAPPAPVSAAESPSATEPPPTPIQQAFPPAASAGDGSLESMLLRMRIVTPEQVATAMREEAETGRPLAEIVVAHGWVSADDMAKLQSPSGAAPEVATAPAPALAPAVAPEPAAEAAPAPAPAAEPPAPVDEEPIPAPAPAPAAAPTAPVPTPSPSAQTGARVLVRLENGERIEVGDFDGMDSAKKRARSLMAELRQAAEWPFLSGRYVRPESIVSIDIDLTAR